MQASKKIMLALSMASLISSVLFASLAILMLIENSPFNIIVNPVGGIEVCILAVFVHCLLNFMLVSMYAPDGIENKFHFQMMTLVKCSCQLILACIIFHTIAVCFGAPVLASTSKTFHFAMLLSASFCLPCCLFLGPNIDNWIDVFLTKSHTSMETVVYFSGIGALVGSWLGAIPIPLDWDRPWQEWPISCVIGALGGYSIGLLLSAVQIPRNYRKLHKSKFF